MPIGPGEPVGKSRGSRTGVDVARRRVGYGDGRGAGRGGWGGADGRRTYHPSYGRHVSVSRLVNVENRLT